MILFLSLSLSVSLYIYYIICCISATALLASAVGVTSSISQAACSLGGLEAPQASNLRASEVYYRDAPPPLPPAPERS